ncbi:MAG: hypothetical protein U0797_23295 [Gemmataceae bacterium]
MSETVVHRDERTIAVENASYRLAYLAISFGLLLAVAYRGFVRQEENSWDLLGLVILGGVLSVAYQAFHHVIDRRWWWVMAASALVAGVIAAGLTAYR